MLELELINAIKNDSNSAFKSLFKQYYSPLVRYISSYTNHKPTSEDIVQHVFLNLWIERQNLNITKSVKAYLYTIAYRTYIDYYRNMKRRDVFFDELKEQALRDAIYEDKEIAENNIKKLRKIVDTLPPKCKEILELNKLTGLKYQEIADHMGISIKTVESQMRIAFQKVREGFKNDSFFLIFIRELFPPTD